MISDALRVQKTISYQKFKIVRSIYQKTLFTIIAIRLEIYIDKVVQIKDKSDSNYYREKKSISIYCCSEFFNTTNYLYKQKSLQQLQITKLKKEIVTELTD